jgi:hypothetical protein
MPELDDDGILVATAKEIAARGGDHPARPPEHGRGSYRPDVPTPDDLIEDELLEWVHAAVLVHTKATTEVEHIALDHNDDELVLDLRNGDIARVAVVDIKEAPEEDADEEAPDAQ